MSLCTQVNYCCSSSSYCTRFCRGGRLLYLIPTTYDFSIRDLPVHPCFSLVDVSPLHDSTTRASKANRIFFFVFCKLCVQGLSTRHGRHLVILQKSRRYTCELAEEFNKYKESVLAGTDGGFSLLMSKLDAALASDAHTNERVVKHCSKRRLKAVKGKERKVEMFKRNATGIDQMKQIGEISSIIETLFIGALPQELILSCDDIKEWFLENHSKYVSDIESAEMKEELVHRIINRMVNHKPILLEVETADIDNTKDGDRQLEGTQLLKINQVYMSQMKLKSEKWFPSKLQPAVEKVEVVVP